MANLETAAKRLTLASYHVNAWKEQFVLGERWPDRQTDEAEVDRALEFGRNAVEAAGAVFDESPFSEFGEGLPDYPEDASDDERAAITAQRADLVLKELRQFAGELARFTNPADVDRDLGDETPL